jgi:hypothetical protein
MRTRLERRTVNLSAYPELVVIYLGMRVNRIAGIKILLAAFIHDSGGFCMRRARRAGAFRPIGSV